MLMTSTYSQAYLAYHGDSVEVDRHMFHSFVLYRLTAIVTFASLVEILRPKVVVNREGRPALASQLYCWTAALASYLTMGTFLAATISATSYVVAKSSPYGLTVTYYNGTNFDQRICTRAALSIAKDYREHEPAWFVDKNKFSSRWEGKLHIPIDSVYTFFSQSDDGLRLYVDEKLVIDNWKNQGWLQSGRHSKTWLAKGVHSIRVEHYDDQGPAALRIKWTGGPIPLNSVLGKPYLTKD